VAGDTWTVELFRDARGRYPVADFLGKQSPQARKTTLRSIRPVLELAKYQPVHTIGRPQVETLEGPIKELRPTKQIRILFSWEEEAKVMLLLEADSKKNGKVDTRAIRRAKANLAEWKITQSSEPIEGL
jgi:hypothetical protein